MQKSWFPSVLCLFPRKFTRSLLSSQVMTIYPHASHLTSLTLRAPVDDPKCKILRILGRKEERVAAVLKDGKRLGRVPASQLKSTATIFIPYSIHWGSKLPFKPQCICTFFTFFRLEANLRLPPLLSPGISNAMYIVHGGQQTQTIWSVEMSCIVELDSTIETHLW